MRAAAAAANRRAILAAARDLFAADGYAATTVAQIAARAEVSVDTVYASVGRKPDLVRAVIDMVLAADEPIPAADRAYVLQIRAAEGAEAKLATYAAALAALLPRLAPLQEVLRQAGQTDPAAADAWAGLVDRRAANMLLLARELRTTGRLRLDLTDQQVADILWATNSAEFFLLLQRRGWTPEEFGALLLDLWTRTLLVPP